MSALICTVYKNWILNLGKKLESQSADSFKVLLMGTGYTPNYDTDCAYQMPTPSAPSVTNSGTGGTVPAGTYQVFVTWVNQQGESIGSSSSSTTTSGSTSTITITSPGTPSPLCSAAGWYAYVTQAGGSTYYRQQTPGSPTALGSNLILSANPTTSGATGTPGQASTADIVANEVAGANGYTTGGAALTSNTYQEILAASFGRAWAASTTYSIGQIIRNTAATYALFECVQAGSSGTSAPTWNTAIDNLTADNSVYWLCIGSSIVVQGAANTSWTVTGAITWRRAVVYDVTTGDLVCCLDPGSTQTGPSSGSIAIDWDTAAGVLASF